MSLACAAAQGRYTVTDLGTLGGDSTGIAINDGGQVVGACRNASNLSRPFLWTPGTGGLGDPQMRDLGTLGGASSMGAGVAINRLGAVAGASSVTDRSGFQVFKAFIFTGGNLVDLSIAGSAYSYAFGINSNGVVVGEYNATAGTRAFRSTGPYNRLELGTLGGANSHAYAINDAGRIVGMAFSGAPNFARRAFLWTQGGTGGPASNPQMRDLGALPGIGSSEAYAINVHGQVAGHSLRAFLWSPDGTNGTVGNPQMRDLGTLGGTLSWAYGINDQGLVVGKSQFETNNSATRAFLFAGEAMHDLNDLIPPESGWVVSEARGVNNRGQIVATGTRAGQTRALLLSPAATLYAVMLSGTGDPTRERAFDAQQVRQALLRFEGVKPENLIMAQTVSAATQAIDAIAVKIRPGDNFLFFYVGHGDWNTEQESEPDVATSYYVQNIGRPGVTVNRGDEYLAVNSRDMFLRNGTPNSAASTITDDQLTAIFQALPESSQIRKWAMLSACFSGGFWGVPGGNGEDAGDLDRVPNTALFASAPEGDTGQAESNLTGDGRSLFVKALEAALHDLADRRLGLSFNHLRTALTSFYSRERFDPSRTRDFFMDGSWFETLVPVPRDTALISFAAATADLDPEGFLASPPPPPSEQVQWLPPEIQGARLLLSFSTLQGRNYRVESTTDLLTGWSELQTFLGDGQTRTLEVPTRDGAPRQFFRIQMLP